MPVQTRILARVVVFDGAARKILLVKNRGAEYWYAPGGGWEPEHETIVQCAAREVHEETGLAAEVKKLLYLQEFHAKEDTIFFETFWLATPVAGADLAEAHLDLDPNGQVERAQWFSQEELQTIKVFPKRLKNTFWENVDRLIAAEDPFIGVS